MVTSTSGNKADRLEHRVNAALDNDHDISISNLNVDMTGSDEDEYGDTDPEVTIREHPATLRHTVLRLKTSRGGIDVPEDKPSEHRRGHPKHQREEDEMLEMNESIQSMASFSDFLENGEGGNKNVQEVKSLEESTGFILSPSSSIGNNEEEKVNQTPRENDKFLRLPLSSTKSSCTVTTVTTSASTEPSKVSCRGNENKDDSEEGDECDDEYPVEKEEQCTVTSNNQRTFATPSTRRSRRPSGYRMNTRTCVPATLYSAKLLLVSPLSVDPSPGHKKINIVHEDLLDQIKKHDSVDRKPIPSFSIGAGRDIDRTNEHSSQQPGKQHSPEVSEDGGPTIGCRASYFIPGITAPGRASMDTIHSRDFVPETPAPLRKSSLDKLPQLQNSYDDVASMGGNGSVSQRSNLSEAFSVPPTPLDMQSHTGSLSGFSMSTVSSRRLHAIPRTILDGTTLGSPNAMTRSVSCSWEDDEPDSCPAKSGTFSHLEERPPTPVKRRQRLRSKKSAYSSRESDADELVTPSSSSKSRAAAHGPDLHSRKKKSSPQNDQGHHQTESPQSQVTSMSSDRCKTKNSSFRRKTSIRMGEKLN